MMKKLIILAGLLVSLQVNAQNYAKQWCADNGDGTYTNPIINSDFPDPDIIRVGIPIIMYLPQCSISLVRQS